jgi:hypothetical protein
MLGYKSIFIVSSLFSALLLTIPGGKQFTDHLQSEGR